LARLGGDVTASSEALETADEKRMSFFEHLEELRKRLKVLILAFVLAFIVFMTFGFQYGVLGLPIWLPIPVLDPRHVIASQFLNAVRSYLIPPDIETIVLTPWEAIVVQFKAALFLSAVATSPIITYEFWAFVGPALKPKEKRLIVRVSTPVVALFLLGVAMSFAIVLPFTIPFLYDIARGIGVTALFQLTEFLDFVLLFSLAFGLAFELPVIMYGLSVLGTVQPEFWKRNWRYAAIAIFVFGAFITPDGSGITMMLVALPMLALYVAGYYAARLRQIRRNRAKTS